MTEYYTVNEMYGEKFYQVPKVFFTNPLYKKGLTDTEKLAFGMLRDRFSLSVKNGWYDDQGRIYFVFSIDSLMDIFGCSKPTAIKIKKSLIKVGLLEAKRRGQGKADLLYLKKPIVTEDDVYKIKEEEEKVIEEEPLNGPEALEALRKSKKFTSKREKNEPLKGKKIDPINTDFKDTDFNDFEEEEEYINLGDVISFLNNQISKRQITNQKTTTAIFEVAAKCKAIGSSDREAMQNYCIKVIEEKMKLFGQKQGTKKPTERKPIRKEVMPGYMETSEEPQKQAEVPQKTAEEKRKQQAEIEEQLKRLRD